VKYYLSSPPQASLPLAAEKQQLGNPNQVDIAKLRNLRQVFKLWALFQKQFELPNSLCRLDITVHSLQKAWGIKVGKKYSNIHKPYQSLFMNTNSDRPLKILISKPESILKRISLPTCHFGCPFKNKAADRT
jgi:hypothetical protein